MEILDFILSTTVSLACILAILILFLRSILSLINPNADGAFFNFIFNVSDFLTAPMHLLFDATGWFSGFPLDMGHFFTVILLWVILTAFTAF